MESLTDILVNYKKVKITRLRMLIAMNDVNSQMIKCGDKNILNERKLK